MHILQLCEMVLCRLMVQLYLTGHSILVIFNAMWQELLSPTNSGHINSAVFFKLNDFNAASSVISHTQQWDWRHGYEAFKEKSHCHKSLLEMMMIILRWAIWCLLVTQRNVVTVASCVRTTSQKWDPDAAACWLMMTTPASHSLPLKYCQSIDHPCLVEVDQPTGSIHGLWSMPNWPVSSPSHIPSHYCYSSNNAVDGIVSCNSSTKWQWQLTLLIVYWLYASYKEQAIEYPTEMYVGCTFSGYSLLWCLKCVVLQCAK